ncbi:MAG: hypothetical protein J6T34_02640 [Bacilli bacterium]|nr:hypothetical protein [Bacilli bacterium]
MEDKIILCEIDMFSAEQVVKLPGGHIERVPLEKIYSYLPTVCYNLNVPKIHLFGNEKFCMGIANQINLETQKLNYSNFNLEIEVN